ncbi:CynX/NimT family MFS transporter [Cellulomonas fimi]|uniref:Major facilitator superfamily MFS_1 n=1 Tax=Cellulomonas fimi (strain ATCC 484 / DSM 20113 / JCM 1341 / CCUG 24087 / LMG 16345 / NBRC 15513 / NCIMB 8980 / NCTC 7547 / NRS-133) TaxID=590998 RepID=F4GZ56_CELFA|nr:MFS transporter [Cellulomonas fimi]AEE47172.1 major facilitator superfamily MFS_1 [Cellulomonas fimi ATCC 484]NNH07691.1 MFS transporter [Cellulomonas fimi]VEH35481.1 Inner membrane transport protein YeaN [Cellulomonas fimi]
MTAAARRVAADGARGLLLAAVLLYALNLRAPITALAPVVDDVQADLALSAAGVGLLTGVPVLCFAVATPLVAVLLARAGTTRVVTASLVTVLLGTVLRSVDGFGRALVGTVLIGVAITAGNVAVPVVIGRDFPSAVPRATGLYTAALNAGSVLTTTLTEPLASLVGWRWALASWGALAVVALVVWRRAYGGLVRGGPPRAGVDGDEAEETDAAAPPGTDATAARAAGASAAGASAGDGAPRVPDALRRPVTWLLAVSFAGQAFAYYAVSAWLPTVLHDGTGLDPTAAGGAAALFQLFGMVGGVAVPIALARRVPMRVVSLAIALGWVTLPVGLVLAPSAWGVWCTLAGVAQGGNFAVIFTVVAQTAGSQRAARRMSAAVQSVGYACGAAGPSVLGAVHAGTGAWQGPLAVVLGAVLLMAVAAQVALRAVRQRPVS